MISEKNDFSDFKISFRNHEIVYILTKEDIPKLNGEATVPFSVRLGRLRTLLCMRCLSFTAAENLK